MDVYKDFIQLLRRKSLEEVCLYIINDASPKLKEFLHLLLDVPFVDGAYHTYYGDVKKILNSFMNYISLQTDEVIKHADRLTHLLDKHELMNLIQNIISIHQIQQINFGKEYLPVTTSLEKQNYEEIEIKYKDFMDKLFQFRDDLENLNMKSKIDDFANDYFKIPVAKTVEIFEFAQNFVSMILVNNIDKIRISVEEILLRINNNLRDVKEGKEESVNKLLNQLYEKNKEELTITRRFRKCSTECNEVQRGMEIIRDKLKSKEDCYHIQRVEEEVEYWKGRIEDLNKIESTLTKLKADQENLVKQEQQYNSMRSIELPGTKSKCWENMGQNLTERKEYLKDMILKAAKALRTHFTCIGSDRICYADNIGTYYVDEFDHQVYMFDYWMELRHKNCDGEFRAVTDKEKYYFDEHGRYVFDDGVKLYQCAECTSQYKLGEDDLLAKVTKDCGHSEIKNDSCHLDIKDPNIVELLPSNEPVDIKKSLHPEVVKYLWDTFGGILPEVLHDVGLAKSMNPIHDLAHKLIYHKYKRTEKEMREKSIEANVYKDNIYKKRIKRAAAAKKEWKSKQVKPRKPEESDDVQERSVYDAQLAQREFINALNYYH